MKKIVYAVLACVILIGTIITVTIGLKADIIYSKNVEIDIYIGKEVDICDIKQMAKEVFPNDKIMIQEIALYKDMVAITLPDKTDEELKDKVEALNTKINEKYGTSNKADDINITHNPKMKLSSILKPYVMPIAISTVIILAFVIVRYKKLGMLKIALSYVLYTGAVEAVFLSILAITRFPINRLVVPIGLVLFIVTITSLSFINEKRLAVASLQTEKTKKK